MTTNLLQAAFGGLTIYVSDIVTDGGRDVVVNSPSNGGQHVVRDRGARLGSARCEVVFSPVSGEPHYMERYRSWLRLLKQGAQTFIHPIHGTYKAIVGPCTESVNAEKSEVVVSTEFFPASDPVPVQSAGAGIAPTAGPEAVAVMAAAVDEALAVEGFSSSAPSDATDASAAWAEAEEPDARKVYLECASIVATIDADIEELGLQALEYWMIYENMMLLRARLRDAAQGVAATTRRTFDYIVKVATPLMIICTRIYGARLAPAKSIEVAQINDLRASLMVTPRTLKMPAVDGTT